MTRITQDMDTATVLKNLREADGYYITNTARDMSQSDYKNRILLHTDLMAAKAPINNHALFFLKDTTRGSRFSQQDKSQLFSRAVLNELSPKTAIDIFTPIYSEVLEHDILDQTQYAYIKYWLPDDLLLKADKMTMAHSLELRVPFLDHTLAEFLFQLPPSMRINKENGHYVTKYILRKAYKDVIPQPILNRPKMGFPVPLSTILKSELIPRIQAHMNSDRFRTDGLFNKHFIEEQLKIFEHNKQSDFKMQNRLWSIFVFLEWQSLFLW